MENKDKEDFNKLFDEQIVYLKEAEFLFDSEKILKQLDHHSNHCYAYNHLRQEKDLNIDEDIQSRNKFHTDFNTLIEEMKKYLSIKDHEINPIKTIPKYYKNSIEWIKELNQNFIFLFFLQYFFIFFGKIHLCLIQIRL